MGDNDWSSDMNVEVFNVVGSPRDIECGESDASGTILVTAESTSMGTNEQVQEPTTGEVFPTGHVRLMLKRKESRIYYYRRETERLREEVHRAQNEVRRLEAGLADIVTTASLTEDVMLTRLRQYGELEEGVAFSAITHPLQILQDTAAGLLGDKMFVIPRGTAQQFVVCKHKAGCFVRVGLNLPAHAVYGVFFASPTNLPVAFRVDHQVADGVTMLASEQYNYANTMNVE
jgi:hypothetical protein